MNCTFATKFIHFYLVVTSWCHYLKLGGSLKAWLLKWVCRLRSQPTKLSVFLQENQMWTLSERLGSHRQMERPWGAWSEGGCPQTKDRGLWRNNVNTWPCTSSVQKHKMICLLKSRCYRFVWLQPKKTETGAT